MKNWEKELDERLRFVISRARYKISPNELEVELAAERTEIKQLTSILLKKQNW